MPTRPPSPRGVAAGRFDLDHVGAHVASCIAQNGPAITCVTSRTRRPSRAIPPGAVLTGAITCPPPTLFDVDGPIAFLTFNRPEARNAMTWAMYEALVEACDRVDADATCGGSC